MENKKIKKAIVLKNERVIPEIPEIHTTNDYDISISVKGTNATIRFKQVINNISKENFSKIYDDIIKVLMRTALPKLNEMTNMNANINVEELKDMNVNMNMYKTNDTNDIIPSNFKGYYRKGKGIITYKIDILTEERGLIIIFFEILTRLHKYLSKEELTDMINKYHELLDASSKVLNEPEIE